MGDRYRKRKRQERPFCPVKDPITLKPCGKDPYSPYVKECVDHRKCLYCPERPALRWAVCALHGANKSMEVRWEFEATTITFTNLRDGCKTTMRLEARMGLQLQNAFQSAAYTNWSKLPCVNREAAIRLVRDLNEYFETDFQVPIWQRAIPRQGIKTLPAPQPLPPTLVDSLGISGWDDWEQNWKHRFDPASFHGGDISLHTLRYHDILGQMVMKFGQPE